MFGKRRRRGEGAPPPPSVEVDQAQATGVQRERQGLRLSKEAAALLAQAPEKPLAPPQKRTIPGRSFDGAQDARMRPRKTKGDASEHAGTTRWVAGAAELLKDAAPPPPTSAPPKKKRRWFGGRSH